MQSSLLTGDISCQKSRFYVWLVCVGMGFQILNFFMENFDIEDFKTARPPHKVELLMENFGFGLDLRTPTPPPYELDLRTPTPPPPNWNFSFRTWTLWKPRCTGRLPSRLILKPEPTTTVFYDFVYMFITFLHLHVHPRSLWSVNRDWSTSLTRVLFFITFYCSIISSKLAPTKKLLQCWCSHIFISGKMLLYFLCRTPSLLRTNYNHYKNILVFPKRILPVV